jgi:hypothetical protein
MLKKSLFTGILLLVITLSSHAQYSMDFGLNLGGATYIGEISNGGSEGFQAWPLNTEWSKTNLAIGGFYRYNFTHKIAAKVSFNFLRIAGADSLSNEPSRIGRNLSFRTDVFELALVGEYNFLFITDISKRSRIDFQAGAVAGIGYSLFYPYAQKDENWYALRPLNTEGPGNEYKEGTLIAPIGLNAAFTFNDKFRLGLEFVYRFTFTDYLDDVSTNFANPEALNTADAVYFANRSAEAYERANTDLPYPAIYLPGKIRGNPESNDGYFLFQANLSYVLFATKPYKKRRIKTKKKVKIKTRY